ncbi:hypothetical protein VTN96DRAFT_7125 [Rasamsonia emersonii]
MVWGDAAEAYPAGASPAAGERLSRAHAGCGAWAAFVRIACVTSAAAPRRLARRRPGFSAVSRHRGSMERATGEAKQFPCNSIGPLPFTSSSPRISQKYYLAAFGLSRPCVFPSVVRVISDTLVAASPPLTSTAILPNSQLRHIAPVSSVELWRTTWDIED